MMEVIYNLAVGFDILNLTASTLMFLTLVNLITNITTKYNYCEIGFVQQNLCDVFIYATKTIICKYELYNTISFWEEYNCTDATGIQCAQKDRNIKIYRLRINSLK